MTTETLKTQAQDLVERGKELATEGNQRQLVFRRENKQLIEVSLTVAVVVAAIALITGFISIPFLIIASLIAYAMGVRVELR